LSTLKRLSVRADSPEGNALKEVEDYYLNADKPKSNHQLLLRKKARICQKIFQHKNWVPYTEMLASFL